MCGLVLGNLHHLQMQERTVAEFGSMPSVAAVFALIIHGRIVFWRCSHDFENFYPPEASAIIAFENKARSSCLGTIRLSSDCELWTFFGYVVRLLIKASSCSQVACCFRTVHCRFNWLSPYAVILCTHVCKSPKPLFPLSFLLSLCSYCR